MPGRSYYVNFRHVQVFNNSATNMAVLCWASHISNEGCVSFDYSPSERSGWMHRIGRDCAGSVGAEFITSSRTVFYQIRQEFLGVF